MIYWRRAGLVVEFHFVRLLILARFARQTQKNSAASPGGADGQRQVACQIFRARVDIAVGEQCAVAGRCRQREFTGAVGKSASETVAFFFGVSPD